PDGERRGRRRAPPRERLDPREGQALSREPRPETVLPAPPEIWDRRERGAPLGAVRRLAGVLPQRRFHSVEGLVQQRLLDRQGWLDPEHVHLVVVQWDDSAADTVEEHLAGRGVVAGLRPFVAAAPAPDRVADRAEVRGDPELRDPPHLPGATESRLDLVRDEEPTVRIRELAKSADEVLRGDPDAGLQGDRLEDDPGDPIRIGDVSEDL